MANGRDRDEFDRDTPVPDVEAHDDEFDADEGLTGEVGSEGGSPGERVRTRERFTPAQGSEASETVTKRGR